jgi:predicted RNA binding protein YcfA (HicA-like mRNA interferase family)
VTRLANISGRQAVKAFERAGYQVQRQTASHIILHCEGHMPLTIPDHKELAPNLLRAQIKLAGMTETDFLALLKK